MPRAALFLVLAVALSVPFAATAEIRFAGVERLDIGPDPVRAAWLDGADGGLLVAGGDGVTLYRHGAGGLVAVQRLTGDASRALAAARLPAGEALVALGGSDARLRVAALAADGVATGEEIALPAAARAVAIGWDAGGAPLVLALHDAGLSVLMRRGLAWRHALAAPRPGTDLAVADLDGDGHLDVLIADETAGAVACLRGDGTGAFRAAGEWPAQAPQRVAAGDVDGDGRQDVLVLERGGLTLHAGAAGGFAAPRRLWQAAHLAALALADLTGDGRAAVLIADRSRGAVTLLRPGAREAPESFLVGAAPETVVVGDLDGDGRRDVLAVSRLGGGATLLRGRPAGALDGVPVALGDLGDISALASADFNGDDHADLAVTGEASDRVGILIGRGDGRFQPLRPFAVGRQPRALAVGDFNQDERPDLAVANYGSDTVSVLLGDGTGGFAAPRTVAVGHGPSAIGLGSFRSPTSADLAIVNALANSVSILYGDGAGRFPHHDTVALEARPSFLMVGDTDQDGLEDLVVGGEYSEIVTVLRGTGSALGAPVTRPLGTTARPSVAEDFDRDGRLDLVTPDVAGGAVQILPGLRAGGFGTAIRVPVGRDPRAIATADFDRDGRVDIAVAHRGSQTIAILLNRSPPSARRAAGLRASAAPAH